MVLSSKLTARQRQALKAIYASIKDSGYPPTLADLREVLGVSSNQAVIDLLKILENKGFIKKEEGTARGIKILNKGFDAITVEPIIPLVGKAAAGPFAPAIEDIRWRKVGNTKYAEGMFLVEIKGDSMNGAGFEEGDLVLVYPAKEFKNGDIVVARYDGDTAVKRLVHDKGKIYLKPENPKYQNIPIYPETRLIGKVIGKIGKS